MSVVLIQDLWFLKNYKYWTVAEISHISCCVAQSLGDVAARPVIQWQVQCHTHSDLLCLPPRGLPGLILVILTFKQKLLPHIRVTAAAPPGWLWLVGLGIDLFSKNRFPWELEVTMHLTLFGAEHLA